MKSIYKTTSPEATFELGKRLAYRLNKGDTLLLFGELGAGKTQLTKGIASGLGIAEIIKSPTFAYLNQFPTENGSFYHYDLYRLAEGADFESLGLLETIENPDAITVIEWADRLGGYTPANYIRVDLEAHDDHHKIGIIFHEPGVVPKEKVEEYFELWATPMHVRAHSEQVAKVAMQIADAYIAQGEVLDLNLLYTGAVLHDVTRVCDFKTLDKSHFSENITEQKWERWKDLRRTHEGFHHADIAKKFFIDEGYPETAEAIYTHKFTMIVTEPERLNTLEKKLIYYADKRVKHDQIVSLHERLADGRERYSEYYNDEEKKQSDLVEKAVYDLEKELFEFIELSPEDVS